MKENNSIKESLQLLLFYVCVSIAGIVCAGAVYTVYVLCTHIVAGQGIASFSFAYFISGMLVTSPVILILTNVFMCLYMIRHGYNGILPTVFYVALYMLGWLVLIPLAFNASASYSAAKDSILHKNEVLSSGYFRASGDKVLYYSFTGEESLADGLVIDFDDTENSVQTFRSMRIPDRHGFLDYLIESTIEMPPVTHTVVKYGSTLLSLSRSVYKKGFVYWLFFAFMGLALVSVSGLKRLSRWRLVNVVIIMALSLCIVLFNIFSYMGLVEGSLFYAPVHAVNNFAKPLASVCNPFALFGNLLFFVVCTLVGVIVHFKRIREAEAEFEEV